MLDKLLFIFVTLVVVVFGRIVEFESGIDLDSFLSGAKYKVLNTHREGRHMYMTRMVTQNENYTFLDNLDVFSIDGDEEDVFDLLEEEAYNGTEAVVSKRASQKIDSSSCAFVNYKGQVYFTMNLKYYIHTTGVFGENEYKFRFRFSARYPGTYLIRFQSKRGSYILIIRTYKPGQVVNFLWPWHRVHVGSDLKAFLMIKPDGTDIFSSKMAWDCIDLNEVLNGKVSNCGGDYNLIFKQRNVAMVEQMRRFNTCGYIKVGNCRFCDL